MADHHRILHVTLAELLRRRQAGEHAQMIEGSREAVFATRARIAQAQVLLKRQDPRLPTPCGLASTEAPRVAARPAMNALSFQSDR
jgi:hypothetical protein